MQHKQRRKKILIQCYFKSNVIDHNAFCKYRMQLKNYYQHEGQNEADANIISDKQSCN